MNQTYKYTLESVLEADKKGELLQWVQDYLRGEGWNSGLADHLVKENPSIIKLMEFPFCYNHFMDKKRFEELMQTIATGWNTKNATIAVECFTDDAIYMEPPNKQLIRGRDELYTYFGGDGGADMKLTWHNLFFSEAKQSGAGEYTFEMNGIIHNGVAIVEIENEKIKFWREYDVTGTLSYEDFLKIDGKVFRFTTKDVTK